MLTHDFMFYPKKRCAARDLGELRKFVRWARQLGYEFRTIDTYIGDDPRAESVVGLDTYRTYTFSHLVAHVFLLTSVLCLSKPPEPLERD